MALTDNLVAYYKLDGNSNDSVGSNNGTDTSISYIAGKINNCASFNGSNSKISIPIGDLINDWTYSFWLMSSSLPSVLDIIMGKITTTSSGRQIEFLIDPSGKITANIAYIKNVIVGSSSNISINNWYNIVFTKSGTTWSVYINGTISNSATDAISQESSSSPLIIGNNNLLNSAYYFNGNIDEVGIWSRALSASEISQLYNSGAGLQYPFTTDKPSLFPFFNQYL